ncbi:RNA polymerase sigma factor SigJ [Pseudonocardia nigra]|uniref:RNA polymerase sigma factor SigJ n=1 Tax=Pseudonocardia nigra TaxID=1921578 RepID=UPI001C5FFED1|nr:RNA polymerase sigma factor SigJ [Pseudonocardia nigra]
MRTDERVFEQHRAHLIGVGYRITGSRADAEDAVQEAWLRLAALDDSTRAELRDERAWLTTVVARLCLDRLRSAAARRERYVGPWLPEPLLTTGDGDEPLAVVVRDEGVRMAAMVVLEQLTPPQRVAFVLHEALALPYADIAEVLGCPEATARQHAARARRIVAAADPPPRASTAEQRAVLERFAEAMARADRRALVELLHPGAALVTDSGGRTRAARRTVAGAEKVARLLLGLYEKFGDAMLTDWTPVLVNGEAGFRTPAFAETGAGVTVLSLRDGKIDAVYQMLNPEKLRD